LTAGDLQVVSQILDHWHGLTDGAELAQQLTAAAMSTVAMTVLTFDPAGVRRIIEHMTAAIDWSREFGDNRKSRPQVVFVCAKPRATDRPAVDAIAVLMNGPRRPRARQITSPDWILTARPAA
jgi:hypothetical protein